MVKCQPFYSKPVNHQNGLQKKKIILAIFIPPIDNFTVKSGQEISLAPVIPMKFMCYKFFLYFSGMSSRGFETLGSAICTH